MGTKMMIFLVVVGIVLLILLVVAAIVEARRMDKGKGSILSRQGGQKKEQGGNEKA